MRLIAQTMSPALFGHVTITLNGEDVTDRCWGADTETGWAGLYKHREGAPYIDDMGEIASEEKAGEVEIALCPGPHARDVYDAWLLLCEQHATESLSRVETLLTSLKMMEHAGGGR